MPCHKATFLQFYFIFFAIITCMMPHTHTLFMSTSCFNKFKTKNSNQSACFWIDFAKNEKQKKNFRTATRSDATEMLIMKRNYLLCNVYPSTSCYLLDFLVHSLLRLVCSILDSRRSHMQSGKNIVVSLLPINFYEEND